MEYGMVNVLDRHLEPVLVMLEQLVEVCPEDIWLDRRRNYWKHVLHAITGIAFWMRQQDETFQLPDFGNGISPDFEDESTASPTMAEVTGYIRQMKDKAVGFLKQLDDSGLLAASAVYPPMTQADVVIMQIRHIQHHIGYCNHILSESGHHTVLWQG
ncbi:DinB family protein [Paenibacillus donghaensis]|uniref:DinB-like domain-containing protein n=1 Tax=Paenibacillus donghaensis TaxID=414771 RepID=A0A2Z2K799_9BACL|nr:DinB family protein [Paenibacillus donghaensis]ASA20867.1 hypothetical protein B9T62_08780 [Paenibacillus donghaensis]